MSDDFTGGPGVWGRRSLPGVERDGVRDGEKTGLGADEFGADGGEVWHGPKKQIPRFTRNDTRSLKATLQRRAAGLFEGVGELQDTSFAESWAKDLEPDREIFLRRFAAGDGDARDAGKGASDGVNVGEIHLERVVGLFAELEGGDGGSGGDNGVDFGEGVAE